MIHKNRTAFSMTLVLSLLLLSGCDDKNNVTLSETVVEKAPLVEEIIVQNSPSPVTVAMLQNTGWQLVSLNGEPLVDSPVTPSLAIAEDLSVSGHSGCNRFVGQLESNSGSQLQVGAMAGTRRACIPKLSELEAKVTDVLSHWFDASFVDENTVQLTGDGMVLTYTKTEEAEVKQGSSASEQQVQ